jgi:hypothetical protein
VRRSTAKRLLPIDRLIPGSISLVAVDGTAVVEGVRLMGVIL